MILFTILFLILCKPKKKKKRKEEKKRLPEHYHCLSARETWWLPWIGSGQKRVLMCETFYLFLTGPSSKIWQPKQKDFNFHFTWLGSYSTVISVANNFITKKNKGSSWTPRCSSELRSEWGLSCRALHGAIAKLASDLSCYKGMHPRSKHGKSEGVFMVPVCITHFAQPHFIFTGMESTRDHG